MKSVLFLMISLFSVNSFATVEVECGTTPQTRPSVFLSIEDDGAPAPSHWDLLVNGRKPATAQAPVLQTRRGAYRVIVRKDSQTWRAFEFNVYNCASDGSNFGGKLEIYERRGNGQRNLASLVCRCSED